METFKILADQSRNKACVLSTCFSQDGLVLQPIPCIDYERSHGMDVESEIICIQNSFSREEREIMISLLSLNREYGGNSVTEEGNYLDDLVAERGDQAASKVTRIAGTPHVAGEYSL